MKWFVIPMMLITLAACQGDVESDQGRSYTVECIDGVEYWLRHGGNGRSYMAPRIDPETLEFVRCSGVDNH
jgi:hypothetical protein